MTVQSEQLEQFCMKLSKNVCSLSLFSVSYHQVILGYNIFCSLISKTMFSKTALAEQTAEVISQDVEQIPTDGCGNFGTGGGSSIT